MEERHSPRQMTPPARPAAGGRFRAVPGLFLVAIERSKVATAAQVGCGGGGKTVIGRERPGRTGLQAIRMTSVCGVPM